MACSIALGLYVLSHYIVFSLYSIVPTTIYICISINIVIVFLYYVYFISCN